MESSSSASSVVSSSSVESSSSSEESSSSEVAPSSSSAAPAVTVVGELIQTIVQGGDFETITFNDVVSYVRKSWNLHFLKIEQSGNQVTVTAKNDVNSCVPRIKALPLHRIYALLST